MILWTRVTFALSLFFFYIFFLVALLLLHQCVCVYIYIYIYIYLILLWHIKGVRPPPHCHEVCSEYDTKMHLLWRSSSASIPLWSYTSLHVIMIWYFRFYNCSVKIVCAQVCVYFSDVCTHTHICACEKKIIHQIRLTYSTSIIRMTGICFKNKISVSICFWKSFWTC